jgi:drug/metabolite transporter (DMT)-like permease
MSAAPKLDGTSWAMIGTMALLWGSAFFLIEIGLQSFAPNTLVFLRLAIVAPFMMITLHFMKERLPRDLASWRQLFILGALNAALPFILFFWGQAKLDNSGYASVLNATTPLWGVIVAHFLTDDEKATRLRIAGVIVGMAGIVVMVGPSAMGGMSANLFAQIACMLSTVFYSFAAIYGRKLGQSTMTPMAVATGQVIGAAIIMLPIMLYFDRPWLRPMPTQDALLATLALAVPATALPYLLYFKTIDRAGALNAMLVAFIMPVVAIAMGIAFLGETLTNGQIAGTLLIALGLVTLDGRIFTRWSKSNI